MNLRDLNLLDTYRTGSQNLLDDFYIPTLKSASSYDRAVGFFSSSLLTHALQGVSGLFANNGRMRLIIGKTLTDDEYQAAKSGHELTHISDVFQKELDEILAVQSSLEKYRLRLFTALIATGKLEIKFAYRRSGMYHEKIGIIRDLDGHKVLFYGSANETTNAMKDLNFESFSVWRNWESDIYDRFASDYETGFEDIWSGSAKGIFTVKLPSKVYERIHQHHMDNNSDLPPLDIESKLSRDKNVAVNNYYPVIPKSINGKEFKLFEHQNKALQKWYGQEQKGLLRLATGAGKTITSLYGMAKMFEVSERPRKILFIVAVPYVALAEQWVSELNMFNMQPIHCFSNKASWESPLSNKINSLISGNIEFVSVVVVNKTLISRSFLNVINRVNEDSVFFVGDECHRHGTALISSKLPAARFRMGLSATPYTESPQSEYQEFDEEESTKDRLIKYYGDVVANYTLHDALVDDVLTPYCYYINVVYLTETETELYTKYSKEIGRYLAISKSKDNKSLSNAIRKRNKIVSNAEGKLRALDRILQSDVIAEKSNTLFYVGEGKAGIDDDDDDLREDVDDETTQLDEVARVIRKNKWKVSSFTAKENKADRKTIMRSFVDGSIDGLVSMRVLDEGIDIPKCERAFILASSRNSRQFVQRRGRILRKFPGKKMAYIYDFLVVPTSHSRDKSSIALVENELRRAMDFVVLSNNRVESELKAAEIGHQFGVDVMEIDYG